MNPAQHEAITLAPATDTRVWARDSEKGKGGREGRRTEPTISISVEAINIKLITSARTALQYVRQ